MMMSLHGRKWEDIRDALGTIGAPVTAQDAGLSREEVIRALVAAKDIRPERYTVLGREVLTEEKAEKLASETGVV